jgi:hypothetical protein
MAGLVRHGLRHTALTWMVDAGVELHLLQILAGRKPAQWSELCPSYTGLPALQPARILVVRDALVFCGQGGGWLMHSASHPESALA